MRIFITGGSGFVGGHVIEALAPHHDLRALARSDRSAAIVRELGAQPVRGELGAIDPSDLDQVDAIIHSAAFVEEWGPRESYWSANVEGTRQLLAAAGTAGVARFIHIGTEAVLFDGRDLVDVDETCPYPDRHRFLYSETKAEAEKLVLAANRDDFTTISLRPRFIWGPRDQTILPAIAEMVAKGGFAWLNRGQAMTSTTHVANLVHAIELSLTRGRGGQAYFILDDGHRSIHAMLSALAATRGLDLPNRNIPGAAARGLARLCERLWRLFGVAKAPPLTYFAAAMMSRTVTLRDHKARAELEYAPVIGVDQGLAELTAQASPSA